ncbi:2-phosphosulfolactate phosphatase [Halobacillus mangrovi]|uniref:Probable 2-phosphosulfolactate phosphatase n=1 Tax=Halobacillus mangrovi TaxID=402384 RepID=A0A1W5ZYI3_9BACI|nr:2-phosphosulfolactate phosphatase [Halobacillus mangrovi]ARI78416.1 2-phosphosulfolactate phosphatase [Halobacillus mangrovi]
MGRIHVIFKKEDIEPNQMKGKIAVVFDVLFATTTITAALADEALSVIPVYDAAHAREKAKAMKEPFVLAGEDQGRKINGFHHPLRTYLQPHIQNKHLILSTTNGTVALQRSSQSEHLYASSLLNNSAMADYLYNHYFEKTILLVCSGSSGRYTMEDFYGVGSLVHYLMSLAEWELSDAAKTACFFYEGSHATAADLLAASRIGSLLMSAGMKRAEIEFAAQEGTFDVIPKYDPNSGQIKEEKHVFY